MHQIFLIFFQKHLCLCLVFAFNKMFNRWFHEKLFSNFHSFFNQSIWDFFLFLVKHCGEQLTDGEKKSNWLKVKRNLISDQIRYIQATQLVLALR